MPEPEGKDGWPPDKRTAAELDHLLSERDQLRQAQEALREIERNNRERSWFFWRWFRDFTLAKWTADRARTALDTDEGEGG